MLSTLVAAGGSREGLDGVAEGAEATHVAPDGAARHLEPLGQLGARPVTARLKEREEIEEPAGGVAHANSMVWEIEDRS